MTEALQHRSLREEQAAATRERILRALRDLIVDEHPDNVSIADVARRAQVAERTIYRHFPTREDLFGALFSWAVLDDIDIVVVHPDVPSGLAETARELFPRFDRNAEIVRAMNNMSAGPEMRRQRASYRRKSVEDAMRPVTQGLPPDGSARRLHALVHLLASSDGFLHMRDFWGLSGDDAARAVAWAIDALAARARSKKGQP